jgi:hypothetical protein
MAEVFPGVKIGQVDFHSRDFYGGDGVSQRHAGVGEAACIDDDSGDASAAFVKPVDNGAFVVGLKALDLEPAGLTVRAQAVVNLGEGDAAIDVGLTGAE